LRLETINIDGGRDDVDLEGGITKPVGDEFVSREHDIDMPNKSTDTATSSRQPDGVINIENNRSFQERL